MIKNFIDIEKIKFQDYEMELHTLFKYEIPLIQVALEFNTIFVWYDVDENHNELWFGITNAKIYIDRYLKNEITLLDLMENSIVNLLDRKNDSYYEFSISKEHIDINEYELPSNDSFLGFNAFQ